MLSVWMKNRPAPISSSTKACTRLPIFNGPYHGCLPGKSPGNRQASRRGHRREPRPRPSDVRKLLLLLIALLSLLPALLVSGAEKTSPIRATKAGKASEKLVVRRWLSSLTLSQKVAQLVVIPFYGE